MNMTIHAIKQVHGVDATTRFEKGPPIHLSYGSITYVSEQPYPETIVDFRDKVYSEVGLVNGHVISAFESPTTIMELMEKAERDILARWESEIEQSDTSTEGEEH